MDNMSLFKCKICGGALEVTKGAGIVTCEYCGTKQTLPKLDDERRANLYDRAGHFRRNSDFDRAAGIYNQILNENPSDAEAYWSLVLCRYGVEYVKDPATGKHVPTVNRAQYTSIFDDEDYKAAIANADGYQRELYEAEASAINDIQKGILEISQREEPFDVFICYKESDKNGRRTEDSVLAAELYRELTREGFRVFYARVTLEDKLGAAYEPYIFAALHSAKVMVVLGTDPANFNAVWVKNEWSRYLALIKNGARKLLIPAYRGMDPYDLPEEFSHLQAQDMSHLGFMQDLVHAIEKTVKTEKAKEAPAAPAPARVAEAPMPMNTEGLLKRTYLFLEDGDFARADELCEQLLNQDPENAELYVIKLMIDLRVTQRDAIAQCGIDFSINPNYQKALRFAPPELARVLEDYVPLSKYNNTVRKMKAAKTEADFELAAKLFDTLGDYRDAAKLREECLEKISDIRYQAAIGTMKGAEAEEDFIATALLFDELGSYKNAAALGEQCREKAAEAKKSDIYHEACELAVSKSIANQKRAIDLFISIKEFLDASKKASDCEEKILKLKRNKIITLSTALICLTLLIGFIFIFSKTYPFPHITENGIEYQLTNDEYHIVRCVETTESQIKIPETLRGKSVTVIESNAFADCSHLSSITIPPSITDIHAKAFYNCSNLTSITIPSNVTFIGPSVFGGCSKLQSITLPFIGARNTGNLEDLLPLGYFFGTYHYTDSMAVTQYCYFGGLQIKSPSTFYIPTALTSVAVTGGNINYGAFYDCRNLKKITIPQSTTFIDDFAFYDCLGLKSIIIPDGVTSIGRSAFAGCTNLTSMTVPDSVISIGPSAFSGCISLVEITLPFVGNKKQTASNSPQYPLGFIFGEGSYRGCTATEQHFYLSSTSNTSYTTYYIPNSLKSVTVTGGHILSGAFFNCKNLTSIYILDGVKRIESFAFFGCSSLKQITLPFIGSSTRLKGDLYQYPFGYIFGTQKYTGSTAIRQSYYDTTTDYTTNSTYYIPASLTSVTITGGNLLYGAFYNCLDLKRIVIASNTTAIEKHAFHGCMNLIEITLPNSITSIGDYAFYDCVSLEALSIPQNVSNIGKSAFYRCARLNSITVDSKNTVYHSKDNCLIETATGALLLGCKNSILPDYITSIGDYAFFHCFDLTNITIPSGVTSIGKSAFEGCENLKTITIPAKTTLIGSHAFYDCVNLSDVIFGNAANWRWSNYPTGSDGASISEIDLTKTTTAAQYLTVTYCDYYWVRK